MLDFSIKSECAVISQSGKEVQGGSFTQWIIKTCAPGMEGVQRNLYLYLLNQLDYLSLKPYSNVLGLNWEQW